MNIIPFQRKKIHDIQFSILSDERKRQISVMRLENSSVIEKGHVILFSSQKKKIKFFYSPKPEGWRIL